MGTSLGDYYVPSQGENFGNKVDPTIEAVASITSGKKNIDGIKVKGEYSTNTNGDVVALSNGDMQDYSNGNYATMLNKWDRFVGDMNKSAKLVFMGASIGVGHSSTNNYTRSFRRLLAVALQNYYETKDVGYVRAYHTGDYLKQWISTSWNHTANVGAYGGGFMYSSSNGADYKASDYFKYIKFAYEGGGGSFEVYIDNAFIGTVDTSSGSGVMHSSEFSATTLKDQEIRIKHIDNTYTKIYGFTMYAEEIADRCLDFQGYVASGMASSDITNTNIDEYFTDNAPCINLVMSNDTNMSTLEVKTQYIIDKCKSAGKMILLLSTPLNGYKSTNDAVFRKLCSANANALYIAFDDIIGANGQVGDNIHPNDIGYRAVAGFLCKQLGLRLPSYAEMGE